LAELPAFLNFVFPSDAIPLCNGRANLFRALGEASEEHQINDLHGIAPVSVRKENSESFASGQFLTLRRLKFNLFAFLPAGDCLPGLPWLFADLFAPYRDADVQTSTGLPESHAQS
jgi:hypothetical protein